MRHSVLVPLNLWPTEWKRPSLNLPFRIAYESRKLTMRGEA
jgi:hypothetical protein